MNKRVEILYQNGVISKLTYDYLIELLLDVFNSKNFIVESDKSNMFWMHLAMTIQRELFGEEINSVDDDLLRDVKDLDNIEYIEKYISKIEGIIGKKISLGEKIYLIVHINNLMEENND